MDSPLDLWHREPLNWQYAKRFSRVIRAGDKVECLTNGMSPYRSMEWAMNHGGGESWAVLEEFGTVPVGVYGWTSKGAIWSYWRDLSPNEQRELMRRTPGMVLEMVEKAKAEGLPYLANYVWEGNRPAVAWLKASHCFSLDLDHSYNISNKSFIAFKTRPAEEIRQYV
jgi:hypothetical protein